MQLQSGTCLHCKAQFTYVRPRKYCTAQCANICRGLFLKDHRPAPKPKRGRKTFIKQCVICGKDFNVNTGNKTKIACSINCGMQRSANQKRRDVPKEKLEELLSQGLNIGPMAEHFNVSKDVIRRRLKLFGLKVTKQPYKLRDDGYFNYSTELNHRRIMEAALGRPLAPREHVHHIDGNKTNNTLNNLIVIEGTGRHATTHGSLQRCAFELVKHGFIVFNKESLEYELAA